MLSLVGALSCRGEESWILADETRLTFAESVVDFSPGYGSGFGTDGFPDVVLGPPEGTGAVSGSTDVLSLGFGGEITLDFGRRVETHAGPDLIVFENPFYILGDPNLGGFFEYAEVALSSDGENWVNFPCDEALPEMGCAGITPVSLNSANYIEQDLASVGGDFFDADLLGVDAFRFVRIRDISITESTENANTTNAGFDLDAIAYIENHE